MEASLSQQLGKQVGPIKNKTEHLIENIDSVMTLLRVMVDPATQNNLRSGVNHIINSLSAIDNLLNGDKGKLKVMLDNLTQITANLKNNNAQINNILSNLSTVSDSLAAANFASTIRKADQVLEQSANIMSKINNGEGTIGKLVNNEQLYLNLDQTSKDLDELLKDLKTNPKRYVHFSVFGKK